MVSGCNKSGIRVSIKKRAQTNVRQEKVLTSTLVNSRKLYPSWQKLVEQASFIQT